MPKYTVKSKRYKSSLTYNFKEEYFIRDKFEQSYIYIKIMESGWIEYRRFSYDKGCDSYYIYQAKCLTMEPLPQEILFELFSNHGITTCWEEVDKFTYRTGALEVLKKLTLIS